MTQCKLSFTQAFEEWKANNPGKSLLAPGHEKPIHMECRACGGSYMVHNVSPMCPWICNECEGKAVEVNERCPFPF